MKTCNLYRRPPALGDMAPSHDFSNLCETPIRKRIVNGNSGESCLQSCSTGLCTSVTSWDAEVLKISPASLEFCMFFKFDHAARQL